MNENLKMLEPVSSYIMETSGKEVVKVWIDREVLPDGRACNTLVSENGEILGCWWDGGPAKQRRGRKSRYCFGDRFDELTVNQRAALSGIRRSVLNDGRIKSRRRSRESRQAELVEMLGTPWMLRTLKEVGAIYEKDGWFYVDRRFLFRG